MTAPALPGAAPDPAPGRNDPARLPPEVDAALGRVLHAQAVLGYAQADATSPHDLASRDAQVAVLELRTAIARALGGDGEPVAWGVANGKSAIVAADTDRTFVEETAHYCESDEPDMGPHTVVPLYTRPAATGDTGEGDRAKVAAWEAAHDSLRDDVLHNADGFDNDIVNHYLGMIDDADQRPYTHIATKGGPDAR